MSEPDDQHCFGDGRLRAVVRAEGAEPVSLRHDNHREVIWQAGAAWKRHAPILFPIVGRLPDDTLRHNGRSFRLTQHGFARDRRFRWVERTDSGCRLDLRDDAETLAMFPFPFALEVVCTVSDGTFAVEYRLSNPGDDMLPASLGAHPAFNWPLDPGVAKEGWSLRFSRHEPAPLRRVENGLLRPDTEPSPIADGILALRDSLFTDDALILDAVRSRSVRLEGPAGSPVLEMSWHGAPQLGLWSKPGANFLCIEPWAGLSTPIGFSGDFCDKPHLLHIPPGGEARLGWQVRVTD